MEMSDKGVRLLTEWEGFELTVYNDSAGLPTIGVGHLLTRDELTSGKIVIGGVRVRYVNGLTEQQVKDLLAQDLRSTERVVNDKVGVILNPDQFATMTSFAFNVGSRAFTDSTLLRLLNQGQYDQVPNQLRRWVHAGGRRSQGLINRRENEVKLWEGRI